MCHDTLAWYVLQYHYETGMNIAVARTVSDSWYGDCMVGGRCKRVYVVSLQGETKIGTILNRNRLMTTITSI